MKSICLVTALTVSDFIDPDLTAGANSNTGAQLGVLTLAALLRQQAYDPCIVNLDDLFFEFVRLDPARPSINRDAGVAPLTSLESFYSFVVRHLPAESFDVVGLSSICSSYPLTLRLAQQIRQTNQQAKIILGGPQASVVDVATLNAFLCVDVIVRGEADDTFPSLLRLLECGAWQTMPGITFRRDDHVIRNPNAPVVENMDRLPLPAFDLDLRLKDRGGVHLEIGRGCPFACTFCSTNDFFRRN